MQERIVAAGVALNKNSIFFSNLYGFDVPKAIANSVGIKYVMSGCESYELNGEVYNVTAGRYLLINEGSKYAIHLDSKIFNQGLCLNIEQALLQNALYALQHDDDFLLANPYVSVSSATEVCEQIYSCTTNNQLGQMLARLGATAQNNNGLLPGFCEEQYYKLGQQLLLSQFDTHRQLKKIKAKTPSVKKELYKRLSVAVLYIEDNISENLRIENLAALAQMSLFHFIRSFSQVYGLTPHQFIIERRMQAAMQLMSQKKNSITEIAAQSGFTDLPAFCKRFKKRFGVTPTNFKTQH